MVFDAGKIQATVDLDRTPFQRKLAETKSDARRFVEERYAATVDADTKPALAKILDMRARLDRLSADRVTPRIDLDGFTEAEARVTILQRQLDHLDRTLSGSGGRGGILGRLASFGQGGFFGGMGLLGVAGGAAALPLGVGALGLGASFLTPAVAGTAGLGLFGATAGATMKRIEQDRKQLEQLNARIAATPATRPAGSPQQIAAAQARLNAAQQRLALARASDTSTPASVASAQAAVVSAQSSLSSAQGGGANPEHDKLLAQRQSLLEKMTPAERAAAKGVDQLENSWKHFQRALEPQTFRLVTTGTDILRKGMHDLLPMTRAVGDEVDDLAKRADKALSEPFWQHFFGDFLTREAPRAVDSLGTTIGNVVDGFAHLAERWAPLGHDLEDTLDGLSGRFDRWTQGGGPQRFLDLVERDGPVAADALSALGSGLKGLAEGFEPIGRVELQALTPVLNFIGELGDQHPEVITALGVAYLGVAGGLKAIAAVNGLAGIAGALRGIGGARVGRGGVSGGILGGLGKGIVPVEVVNWPPGLGGPGGVGGVASKERTAAEEGAVGRFSRLGGLVGGALRLGAGALALSNVVNNQTKAGDNKSVFDRIGNALGSAMIFGTQAGEQQGSNRVLPYDSNVPPASSDPNATALAIKGLSFLPSQADKDYQRAQAEALKQLLTKGLGRSEPPVVINMPGATFTGVNDPKALEHQLRERAARARAAKLGSGVSFDNIQRMFD